MKPTVIAMQKLVEEKLKLSHINSADSEIRKYKSLYADFVYGNDKQNIFRG